MAKTVRVLLHAGLGNQMFMYAAGRALALRIGARLVVELRRFAYEHVYHRIFLLDQFPIEAVVDEGSSLGRKLGRQVEAQIGAFSGLRGLWGLIRERSNERYEPRLVETPPRRSVVLDGYWQNERYFADHAAAIRRELAPPRPTRPEILSDLGRVEAADHPVAVCIRTFREAAGGAVDIDRVLAAYRSVLARHSGERPGAAYFVATDWPEAVADPDCLGVPFTVIGRSAANEMAPENLHVLSRCREFFLRSGTFHWWAAWLSPAVGKRIHHVLLPGEAAPWNVPATWLGVEA